MRKMYAGILAIFLLAFTAVEACAEGYALYEWSARGLGLGGATVARRRADPSAVASNPALITKLKGGHLMAGASALTPRGDMDYIDNNGNSGSSSLKVNTWVMPHFYYTQQLSDKVFFGIGEFTRFGLGFEYPHDWAGRFNIYEVSLKTASINPNLAFAVTDDFSIAVGLEIMYLDLHMNKRVSQALPYSTTIEVDSDITHADNVSFGANLALHWNIDEHWSVGFSYRSPVEHTAHGKNEFSLVNYSGVEAVAQGAFNTYFKDSKAHGKVTLPESFHGAVAWQPREDLSIEVGAVYTRWSRFDTLDIYLEDPQNTVSKNEKDWKDVWRFNVGVEYDALDWLTVRAGYVFDQSPMTNGNADYLVPTDDRHIFSLGLGARWDDWTVDLGYAYIYALSRDYDRNDTVHTLNSKSSGYTNVFSLSVGYEF